MNVLGLDPGLTRTGWGIVSYQNQKLIYISSGTIGSKSSDKIDKRLVNIDIKLSNIIFAVDETVKTLNCKKEAKRGCNHKSVKCITHNLWDELDQHINSFFENKNLEELLNQNKRI